MPTQWLLTSAISAASFAAFDPHGSMPHMNLCASKKIRVVHHLFATEEEEAIEASDVRRTSRISVYERTLSLEPEVRLVHTHTGTQHG